MLDGDDNYGDDARGSKVTEMLCDMISTSTHVNVYMFNKIKKICVVIALNLCLFCFLRKKIVLNRKNLLRKILENS